MCKRPTPLVDNDGVVADHDDDNHVDGDYDDNVDDNDDDADEGG